jgi:hypothetical protein
MPEFSLMSVEVNTAKLLARDLHWTSGGSMTLTCRPVVATILTLSLFRASALAQRPGGSPSPPPVPEVASEPQGLIEEPDAIRRAALFGDRHFTGGERKVGFYADIKSLIPGSGWLGAGPGYRMWYAKDRALLDVSGAISTRAYKAVQARFELPKLAHSRLAIGSQFKWQDATQVAFFGDGPLASESNRSEYRLRSNNLVGYATFRPLQWIDIGAELGWLTPEVLPRAGGVKTEVSETQHLFPTSPVFSVGDQPSFLHSKISIIADTRDFPDHTLKGTLLRAAMADYSDRDTGRFSFKRYEVEGAEFLPLAGSRVVLALHGWLVASDTDDAQFVPFYLEPSLGGNQSLRAYDDYRFHDRHLLLLNIETRVALMTHLDAAFLFDAGNVASRIGDLDLGRRSYGGGVRFHTRRVTFARFDVAYGSEGWRANFGLSDPLALTRLSRHTATAPFVP